MNKSILYVVRALAITLITAVSEVILRNLEKNYPGDIDDGQN